jgi:hypothetical protein
LKEIINIMAEINWTFEKKESVKQKTGSLKR